jgi:hypothetical protein
LHHLGRGIRGHRTGDRSLVMSASAAAPETSRQKNCCSSGRTRGPSMIVGIDIETDVVVVGFGAAGVAASVTAYDLAAKVVILEKALEGQEGGNTRVAGQGDLNISSVDQAVAYPAALCGPYTVPKAMMRVWAGDMPEQCMAGKPRRRSTGASASVGRNRIPGSTRFGLRA